MVPSGGETDEVEQALWARVGERLGEYLDALDALQFRRAAASLRALWAEGNVYLEDREPWRSIKVDESRTAATLRTALQLGLVDAVASAPFLPGASDRLRAAYPDALGAELRLDRTLIDTARAVVGAGDRFEAPPLLFTKLTPEELAGWADRFSGDEDATDG